MSSLMRSESMCYPDIDNNSSKYEKKKIMVPPTHYDLLYAPSHIVYQHISYLTKNDIAATHYLNQIKPIIYNQVHNIVSGYIPAPPIDDITRQVIGNKGHFFKMTTSLCGVYFIWHDTVQNLFLFWGPSKFSVVKAMNSIRWRIFKFYEMYNNNQQEYFQKEKRSAAPEPISEDDAQDDDYADMPPLISMGTTPDHEHY